MVDPIVTEGILSSLIEKSRCSTACSVQHLVYPHPSEDLYTSLLALLLVGYFAIIVFELACGILRYHA